MGRRLSPKGAISDLATITIPFLMAFLRIRFRAKETHCPASAVSTGALHITYERPEDSEQYCNIPLPLDRLYSSICPTANRVWPNHNRVSRLYSPRVKDPVYYGTHIRHRPHYKIEIRRL